MNLTILWITLITIFGLALRIIGIAKSGGLWNDEYISWSIASIPFGKGFFTGIASQCHMPLYYLYLKFFNIFSSNDIFLRFTSIIPAIISIPIMYLLGKEKNKLTGLMCSLFTALSSFLIYYSQEVRFYSLLFLFSALAILFTIRLLKKTNVKNSLGFIISNLLIIFTHTIGFIFVFLLLIFVTIKLYKKNNNKILLYVWIVPATGFILLLPLIYKIITTVSFSQWWANLTITKIIQVFADFFSPIIAHVSLIDNLYTLDFNTILCILPTTIAILILIASMTDINLKKENQLGYVAICFFIIILFIAMSGKMVLETKYIIEIYPILIFMFCNTVSSINKKWFQIFIFALFFTCQIIYIFAPTYAAFLPREEGNKYVADLINSANLKNGDFIILTYYPQKRFTKYQDFSKYNVIEIHKGNFNEYYLPKLTYQQAVKTGKNEYRGTFINSLLPTGQFAGSKLISELNDKIYYNMQPGQKVIFIFLDSVSFIDETILEKIATNNNQYFKTPLLYLVFSNIRNEIVKTIPKQAKNIKYEVNGSWTAVSFQR